MAEHRTISHTKELDGLLRVGKWRNPAVLKESQERPGQRNQTFKAAREGQSKLTNIGTDSGRNLPGDEPTSAPCWAVLFFFAAPIHSFIKHLL